MTFPTTFANLTAGNQPASLLDAMFNILGGSAPIPCTATGTNAITLTPVTNNYQPAAYANYQPVAFVAANSSTGAVTIQLGALGFVNLYMPSGLQANNGDIVANNFYVAAFNGALNSGSGGFQVFNASTPSVVQPVQAGFKNLQITNGGTPDSQIAVTADQVMLQNNAGGSAIVRNVSVTISTGSSGANGLDSGVIAQATWYAVYVIYNGSTIAGLMSTSFTSPTLPSGYTYFARLGAFRTGNASTNLKRILQLGRTAQYVVTPASQTTVLPVISSAIGAFWTAFAVANFVPTTAAKIRLNLDVGMSSGSSANCGVAPNNNYGTSVSTTPFPLIGMSMANSAAVGSAFISQTIDMLLESTNIYAGASGSVTATLSCLGWEDNI